MKCSVSTRHPPTEEFDAADLNRLSLTRLKERFRDVPLNSDGYVCDPCAQWLTERLWNFV